MSEVRPTEAECVEALDRIARTSDGATFYVFLQRSLMSFPMAEDDGALRSNHGERRFAGKLIGFMKKGIAESVGRTSNTSGSSTGSGEQPVVVPVASPVRVGSASRAGARRVTADTIVPGWNDTKPDAGDS